MIINNNLMAMNSHRMLGVNVNAGQKVMEKLSSGMRINRAADDAAGLAISEKMRAQIRGLNQASRNAQDGISLIQTAEGALDEAHSILQRMRELAVQAANGTYQDDPDRNALQDEVNQLIDELNRISSDTEFNKMTLLDGTFSGTGNEIVFQIGANEGQTTTLNIGDMSAAGLGVSEVNIATISGASSAITTIDSAIDKLSTQRSALGAVQNRLEHTIKNLDNAAENLQAAESRIRDADMAKEMMNFTRSSILQQASIAMLAQANMAPQSVLQLLG